MVINILPESKNDPKIYEMSNGIIYSRKPGSTERIIEGYLKNDISSKQIYFLLDKFNIPKKGVKGKSSIKGKSSSAENSV